MDHPIAQFMEAAIKEALKAKEANDYAIGAVIVRSNKIIIGTPNRIKIDGDPTHHAEIVAIRQAAQLLDSRHLKGCVLYTTHESCPMCASAAIWARMDGIVFGARTNDMTDYSLKNGNQDWSWRTITISASEVIKHGDPQLFLIKDFMRDECVKLFHSQYEKQLT